MKKRFKIFVSCALLLWGLTIASTDAQIFQDTAAVNLLRKGIASIYDLKFSQANEIYNKINQIYPEHPVVIFFKGMITYWENFPLIPTSTAQISFEEDMRKSISLSEKCNDPLYESEYLLANLCARGILLTYYANNELNREAFHLAKNSYQNIRRSFSFTADNSDFYFFTGLYNYYREVYPKEHPLYRPLAMLFPRGNREKGLTELQYSALNSVMLRAESYSILSYIYMSYENDYGKAFSYSKSLHDTYPANTEYLAEYIKNLLLMKQYDDAENLISSLKPVKNETYFAIQLNILEGILQEKKYHNNPLSLELYNKGIEEITAFGKYGNEYAAYAYFGLSRISSYYGDKNYKKIYRKKALDLADIKKVDFD